MKTALVLRHLGFGPLGMRCSGYYAGSSETSATDFAGMEDGTGLAVVSGAQLSYAGEDLPLRYLGYSPVLHRHGEGLD